MLSLGAPLWLLGLAGVPVLRWLHRSGAPRQPVWVAHAALFEGSVRTAPSGAQKQPPDPAWRRRALVLTLLVLALAAPRWVGPGRSITVWLDDTPSLQVREADGRTRLAQGMAEARAAWTAADRVQVRRFSDPWRALAPDAVVAASERVPPPPPKALWEGDGEAWLVTDATQPQRLAGYSPHRLIAVGRVARNAGLVRLAARRTKPDAPLEWQVSWRNGGNAPETRQLEWRADGGVVQRVDLPELAPGQVGQFRGRVAAQKVLEARLLPADALPEDDPLRLELGPLRPRRIDLGPGCAPALEAALRAHPLVQLTGAEPELSLQCGLRPPPSGRPTLRLLTESAPRWLSPALQWEAGASPAPAVGADPLPLSARLSLAAGDRLWLAVAGEPALVARAVHPLQVDSALDLQALATAGRAEAPLLLNAVLERWFDAPLLHAVAERGRAPEAVDVASQVLAPTQASPPQAAPKGQALQGAVGGLALAVLLWELVALARLGWRQWRWERA